MTTKEKEEQIEEKKANKGYRVLERSFSVPCNVLQGDESWKQALDRIKEFEYSSTTIAEKLDLRLDFSVFVCRISDICLHYGKSIILGASNEDAGLTFDQIRKKIGTTAYVERDGKAVIDTLKKMISLPLDDPSILFQGILQGSDYILVGMSSKYWGGLALNKTHTLFPWFSYFGADRPVNMKREKKHVKLDSTEVENPIFDKKTPFPHARLIKKLGSKKSKHMIEILEQTCGLYALEHVQENRIGFCKTPTQYIPSHQLDISLEKATGKVTVNNVGIGTCFYVSKSVILTCLHVFTKNKLHAKNVQYKFLSSDGRIQDARHKAELVFPKFDLAFILVDREVENFYCMNYGDLFLKTTQSFHQQVYLGKVYYDFEERQEILHHQFHQGSIIGFFSQHLIYQVPTQGGDSGSPVINETGLLIGIHHGGESVNFTNKRDQFNIGIRLDIFLNLKYQIGDNPKLDSKSVKKLNEKLFGVSAKKPEIKWGYLQKDETED